MLGSYDQVLVAAANPPVKYFSFFLTSLLETVRINIGDCVSSAYTTLTVAAASKILMFTNEKVLFLDEFCGLCSLGMLIVGDIVVHC